ncbi:hypothetical protein ACIBJE_02310 [Micromonospora sp. NPDC050187]|uniref:hypothetical protein n=1 Tax=Micromonospora sp. NPDC050187 TaxID=3364277 RepID=UPI00378B4C00
MTHPNGGNGGTTGPGRTQATALTAEQRADNYRRQNGTDRQTPRQRRRAEHKANRAKARQTA